jgi:hypothetical protein
MLQPVERKFCHKRIDQNNAAYDRWIAASLRRNGRLLRLARQNLRRWIARDGRKVRPVFGEWQLILTRLSRLEIADFLQSETPMARRLRQSSPFAGLLIHTRRGQKKSEKARA